MRWTLSSVAALSSLVAACTSNLLEQPPTGSMGGAAAGGESSGCPAGQAECGDGSCVPLDTQDNCGACGLECTSHNGTAACVDGSCQISCDSGFADCNGDPQDGCEVNLLEDAGNCTACGVVCSETDCLDGTCVSILATAPAAFVGADWLLTIGPDLYWATPGIDAVGEIAKVSQSGGPITPLVTSGTQFFPYAMRSNGASLVYGDISTPGIYGFALPTGPGSTTVPASAIVHVLDVDETDVWFTDTTNIERASLGGGSPVVIASGLTGVRQGRLFDGVLYVTLIGPDVDIVDSNGMDYVGHPQGSLLRVTGDTVETLAEDIDTPTAIIATSDAIFWAESGSMATYGDFNSESNLGTLGRIVRAAHDGSGRVVLADNLVQPGSLAADATYIYFANAGTVGGTDPNGTWVFDGSVQRVPLGGGAVETVVPAIDARSITLSDSSIFFSSWFRGLVLRKTKPQ